MCTHVTILLYNRRMTDCAQKVIELYCSTPALLLQYLLNPKYEMNYHKESIGLTVLWLQSALASETPVMRLLVCRVRARSLL
jgi:hypothetical protein